MDKIDSIEKIEGGEIKSQISKPEGGGIGSHK
jgi:hypothetical protein